MSAQEASQQDGTTEKDGMKDARMVKQWSAWGILLAVVLVAVGWLWWAPVGVTIAVALVCLWSWFYVPMVTFRDDT